MLCFPRLTQAKPERDKADGFEWPTMAVLEFHLICFVLLRELGYCYFTK
jgi:hypothetical protein